MSPQNAPRITEYIEVIISPGRIIRNTARHLSSEKSRPKIFCPPNIRATAGTVKIRVLTIPAVTTAFLPAVFPSAFCFVISRDTVIGTPEDAAVSNTENTERAIWYMPSPSAPIMRDNAIL